MIAVGTAGATTKSVFARQVSAGRHARLKKYARTGARGTVYAFLIGAFAKPGIPERTAQESTRRLWLLNARVAATAAGSAVLASAFASPVSRDRTATLARISSAPKRRGRPVLVTESAYTTSASVCPGLPARRARQRPSARTTARGTAPVLTDSATASHRFAVPTATRRWPARTTVTLVVSA